MFLRGKVRWSDLWVTRHPAPSDFYLMAWQRGTSPLPLLGARLALAAAAAGVLAWSLAGGGGGGGAGPLWLIYLTNWGLVLVAAAALAAFFVSCMAAYDTPPEGARALPRGAPLYWLLFNAAQTVALAITLLYWALLYDPETWVHHNPTAEAAARDVATHAGNSALTLAELALARTPARALHAWQPLLPAAAYVAFSALYHAAGGTNLAGQPYIYAVLDWSRPGVAGAAAGGALAAVLALHALVCALARARAALAARCGAGGGGAGGERREAALADVCGVRGRAGPDPRGALP